MAKSSNPLTKPRLTPIGFYCIFTMKKLPLFIIACLLVSVTTWAVWKKPEQNPAYPLVQNLTAQSSLPICCSSDGKIIYVSYTINVSYMKKYVTDIVTLPTDVPTHMIGRLWSKIKLINNISNLKKNNFY